MYKFIGKFAPLAIAVLGVVAVVSFASNARAAEQSVGIPSVTVRYADLNLNTAEGVEALYARLRAAAKRRGRSARRTRADRRRRVEDLLRPGARDGSEQREIGTLECAASGECAGDVVLSARGQRRHPNRRCPPLLLPVSAA